MIPRPSRSDAKLIGWGIGRMVLIIGLIMLAPLAISIICKEWNTVLDFLVGITACLVFWLLMENTCRVSSEDFSKFHGLVVVSGGWLVSMLFSAIPHFLSGHFGSYLDACFDIMSGYTTTGFFLIQDLDHVSHGLNTWRHVLTYVGGQGIIVVALTFLFVGTAGAFRLYAAEAKEERLLPNMARTARAIWMISLVYLVVGSAVLFICLVEEGMPPWRGFLHATWLFMGAWSTGGFAPQSLNLMYYHSLAVEIVTLALFIIGSFNFALHYSVWTGNIKEAYKNIEIRSFATTLAITTAIMSIGFAKAGTFTTLAEYFRKGFYNLASGHTATGNSTVYSRVFLSELGAPATWAIALAMAIGGSMASTAGGIKNLRVGIVAKSIWHDIKRAVMPGSAVARTKIHHIRDIWLDDAMVRGVMLIVIAFIALYLGGGILGILYGYTPTLAFFDAVSAGSTTGLSTGVNSPLMPALMKVYYIFAMWAGRLEFVSVFALVGMAIALVKGKGGRKI